MAEALINQLRAAFVARLREDPALVALLGEDTTRIARRPQQLGELRMPLLTYFDFGKLEDDVPLEDRIWQIDVWGPDADANERIAERAQVLLHRKPLQVAGLVRGVFFRVVRAFDKVEKGPDGAIVQTVREFRQLAYLNL